MGYSSRWVGVRVGAADGVEAAELLDVAGFPIVQRRDDWQWGTARRQTYPDVVDAVAEIARALSEPSIGGWIFDSDWACVVGASPDGALGFRFPINGDLEVNVLTARSGMRPSD